MPLLPIITIQQESKINWAQTSRGAVFTSALSFVSAQAKWWEYVKQRLMHDARVLRHRSCLHSEDQRVQRR